MNPEYYLVWGDSRPGPYSLQDLYQMVQHNQITTTQQVIHQGNTLVVGDVLRDMAMPAHPGAMVFRDTLGLYVEISAIGVAGIFAISFVLTLLTLFVSVLFRPLVLILSCLHFILYMAYVVLYCIWNYRSHINVQSWGARDLWFTPPWTVISWFIPFINYVWPFMAIQEIAKASKDPANWKTQSCTLVNIWWGSFALYMVSSIALSIFAFTIAFQLVMSGESVIPEATQRLLDFGSLPVTVTTILWLVCSAAVVRSIRLHQEHIIATGRPKAPDGSWLSL